MIRSRAVWSTITAVIAAGVVGSAGVDDEPISAAVERIGRTRWTVNNRVQIITGPEEAWQARLELIGRARHHVFISTFSWHNDEYGLRFRDRLADLLRKRRQENPDFAVYCIVDASALPVFDTAFRSLEEAGAKVRAFHRDRWGAGPMYDWRMHDKMLIVDGREAIVTGRNYADLYFDPTKWWLDFGVRLEGDAVHQLQMHFLKSWEAANDLANLVRFAWPEEKLRRRVRSLWLTGRFPNGSSPLDKYLNSEFFPPYPAAPGDLEVAVLYDSSMVWSTAPSTELAVELIRRSRSEVDLMTPFPNFDLPLVEELESAAARGVKVRLFVNGADAAIRRGAFYRSGLPTVIRLLEAGVDVWAWRGDGHIRRKLRRAGCDPVRLPPIALHGKLLRVDDELSIVHSSNFNIRSTYYNTEAGVVVRDRDFNRELRGILDALTSDDVLTIDCEGPPVPVGVEHVVELQSTDDIPELEAALGRKQGYLDSMGMLW